MVRSTGRTSPSTVGKEQKERAKDPPQVAPSGFEEPVVQKPLPRPLTADMLDDPEYPGLTFMPDTAIRGHGDVSW